MKTTKKNELTAKQKRLDVNLWIIALVTMVTYGIYGAIGKQLLSFCKDGTVSVWPRLFASAGMEFGMAGLGITLTYLCHDGNPVPSHSF